MFDFPDALLLARIQFAFTVSFHFLFPAITIGLASYLAVLEGLWLYRKDTVYRDLYHFWSKVFAVNFGMGVVSGVVMAYQFGTNWSVFSDFAGSITGGLLGILIILIFYHAKEKGDQKPAYEIHVSREISCLMVAVYLLGIVYEIIYDL